MANPTDGFPQVEGTARILVVDDEPDLLYLFARALSEAGFDVDQASDGTHALRMVREQEYDAILSDIMMPGMDGLTLLRTVRERNLDVPVVLITGRPALDSAMQAVEYGALKYLTKPVQIEILIKTAKEAVNLHRVAKLKRQALELLGTEGKHVGDRAGVEAIFDSALRNLWMAYQPIIRWSKRKIFAYEALMRSNEPAMPSPMDILDAAERLHRIHEVGQTVRRLVAQTLSTTPVEAQIFVNLHTLDLEDKTLFVPSSPFARYADRIVLEITERASLDHVKDVQSRVLSLRELGFRIAIDDLGAGYAGLTSFAQLQPDVVKLDMTLVRDVHTEPTKLRLVKSMTHLCAELGMLVVAEGVETPAERDALIEAGCDLLQGYLFAKPGRPFPQATF